MLKKEIGVCNRLIAEQIIPRVVERYNAGIYRDDYGIFESKQFLCYPLAQFVSSTVANEYIELIRVERGRSQQEPGMIIISLTLPYGDEVGQAALIGIIINQAINKVRAYSMEISLKHFMICQWTEHHHFNYGTVHSRAGFFSTIIKLAKEDFRETLKTSDLKNQPPQKTDIKNQPAGSVKKKRNFLMRSDGDLPVWAYLVSGILILSGIVILVVAEVSNRSGSVNPISSDEYVDEESLIVEDPADEEYNSDENYHASYEDVREINEFVEEDEDLTGETFTYYPEDGTIRTSKGKIVSEGTTQNTRRRGPTRSQVQRVSNEYDNVPITRYHNGQYP